MVLQIKEPDGTNTLAYNRGNLYYMPSSMLMDAPQNNQNCAIAGEYVQSDFAHLSPEEQHTQFNISMGRSAALGFGSGMGWFYHQGARWYQYPGL